MNAGIGVVDLRLPATVPDVGVVDFQGGVQEGVRLMFSQLILSASEESVPVRTAAAIRSVAQKSFVPRSVA